MLNRERSCQAALSLTYCLITSFNIGALRYAF